jgi:hypothetical protein
VDAVVVSAAQEGVNENTIFVIRREIEKWSPATVIYPSSELRWLIRLFGIG